MGGDLVVVLVVRVAPEYGVLGAPGGCVVTVGQVLPGHAAARGTTLSR